MLKNMYFVFDMLNKRPKRAAVSAILWHSSMFFRRESVMVAISSANSRSAGGAKVQNVDIGVENGGTFCFCDFFARPPPFEQKVPIVLFDFRNFRGDHPKSCKKYHLNFWFSRFARHHHPQNMVLFAKNQKVLQSKLDIP